MKICLFVIFVILSLNSQAQTKKIPSADTSLVKIELVKTTGKKKFVQVHPGDYFELVCLESTSEKSDTVVYQKVRVLGQVEDFTYDSIFFVADQYSKRIYNDYENLYLEQKTIAGDRYSYKTSLSKIDGVYYSSSLKMKLRNATLSVIGVSLFAALIVAPLYSMEYIPVGEGSYAGFNRKRYISIATSGISVTAIGFCCYFLLKPKYYSFAYDDYKPKRNRWTIGLAPKHNN